MKKKIYIVTLFLALLFYGKAAYAIFDPLATVQSALELKDEIETKLREIKKFKTDLEKRIKQGYAAATSCFKNPLNCNLKKLTSLSQGYERIKLFPMMSTESKQNPLLGTDLTKTASEDISKVVRDVYVYKEGKESLSRGRENRDGLNSVVSNQVAILFAKGAMAKKGLQDENSADIYEDPSSTENNNKDSIMYLQGRLDLMDNIRLARILEMKGYMQNAPATAGLLQQSIKEKEGKE